MTDQYELHPPWSGSESRVGGESASRLFSEIEIPEKDTSVKIMPSKITCRLLAVQFMVGKGGVMSLMHHEPITEMLNAGK